jgi:hypothetical protein
MIVVIASLGIVVALVIGVVFVAAARSGKAVVKAYVGSAAELKTTGMYFSSNR